MSRPRRPRKPSPLHLWQRFLCAAVVAVPPVVLAGRVAYGFLDYLDRVLAKSAPLASAFASASLRREVRIEKLTPFLSVRELWRYYQTRDKLGTLPIVAENITVAKGETLAATGELAYIKRLTAFVSVPALLGGESNTAITRIEIASPRLFLARRKDGSFNVQELVKESNKPPGAPFVTTLFVTDAAIRFVDSATKFPVPQTLDLFPVNASATLGSRALRFDVSATPKPGTATSKRVRGTVAVSGTFAQGKPGTRPDAALASDPQYTLRAAVPDADLVYFARYVLGDLPATTLSAGRAANLQATFVSATVGEELAAKKAKRPAPPPRILLTATLRGVDARVQNVPTPLKSIAGNVRFVSAADLVSFDLTASAFASPVTLTGSVWNIGQPSPPRLAVRFDAPQVPLPRVLTAFAAKLPPGVSVSGTGAASGTFAGTFADPSGVARVRVPQVGLRNVGTARNIVADLRYASGVLDATRLTAQTDPGGNVSGSGRVRFAVPGKNGLRVLPPSEIAADFSAQARNVSLSKIAKLARTKIDRLGGTADVAVTGSSRGGKVSLAADVSTRGLTVGGLAVPVAQARLFVRDNALVAPFVRFQSPALGTLLVAGDTVSGAANAPLALRFTASGLDAGRLARAFGVRDVSGVVDASGTVGGTLTAPVLTVSRLSVLNPRYQKYTLQAITGANIVATKTAVTVDARTPIVARRFPASVVVSGRVTDFLPGTAGKVRPVLDLLTKIKNVDYSTVAPFLPPPDPKSPPLAGTLTQASVRVTGFADAPRLQGTASVRRVLLADYPVEAGEFAFGYENGLIRVSSARITASAGTVTAKATITRSGQVYGSFAAPALDLSRVSYLTQNTATLGGIVAVSGTFSGTRDRPIVTASIAPSNITVAGTAINNLSATNIRYIANLQANVQRVEVPRLSLEQAGNTRLQIENAAYDLRRKTFGATVMFRTDSADTLVSTLRQSAFAQTLNGKQAVAFLGVLPSPLDGAFPATRDGKPTNRVTVSGTAGDSGINYRVRGELFAQNLRAGAYAADTVRVTLDKGSAAETAFGKPNIGAETEATNLRIGDFLAQTVIVNGSLVGDTATVSTGRLVSGTTTINASGTANLAPNGQIKASLDSNAVSFDLIRAFVPTLPLQGAFDITAFATGATRSPDVQASVGGQNIAVVPRTEAGLVDAIRTETPSTVLAGAAPAKDAIPADAPRFSFNAIARVRTGEGAGASPAGRVFELSDVQVSRRGGGQLLADARIPFSYAPPYVRANAPISATITLPQLELETLNAVTATDTDPRKTGVKQEEPAGLRFFGGTVAGQVILGGTLRAPDLRGGLTVTNGVFSLPKVKGRETFNRVRDWDASILLLGSQVNLDTTLALAGTNGRGDNGKLTVAGNATVSELESALNAVANLGGASTTQNGTGTVINRLTATFDNVKPVAENLLFFVPQTQLTATEKAELSQADRATYDAEKSKPRQPTGESFRGTINGVVSASGTLASPLIATPTGQPLRLTDVRLTPPVGGGESVVLQRIIGKVKRNTETGARFAVQIDAPGKNNISLLNIVSVDVSGIATIAGTAGRPSVRGRFLTQGGSLQYGLGRFTLDKGGQVILSFLGDGGSVEFQNVVARTTTYLRPGATISGSTGSRGGLPIAQSQPGAEGAGTRYRITAQLQDKFFFGANADETKNTFKLIPSSDPPLTEQQIYALLVPSAQLAGIASGDFSKAGTQLLQTAFQQSLLPGLFSPIESRVASAFGLEQFSLDYSPSAPLTINLLKRFPDPFQRFVAQYSRTLPTGGANRTGAQVPYSIGLLYELYQLRSKRGQPIPRIQFGFFTNEQRDFSGNLRATIVF